jgi:hypothetical protein
MLRKRRIKNIYTYEVICGKCGRPMNDTGRIALTCPAKYIYECQGCNYIDYLPENKRYEIEYWEEDEDV